ncbi:MAG TPA: tetratricopeptide repeat protein [Vicinamibacterales bacterium]
MPIDRNDTLKKAEKLLRQGRLDAAIAEYLRIVEDQPRDWTSTNTLGDLYVRAGQSDTATAQYTKIADHLFREGFYARAGAIYKKILKVKPDDDRAQLQLADVSVKQGLLADAKSYLVVVAERRRARGDRKGAAEIVVQLGSVDPSDIDARVAAARALCDEGDAIGAAIRYRTLHADLLEKGRAEEALAALHEAVRLNPDDVDGRAELARHAVAAGDIETAKLYLDRDIAGEDPSLLMALMEIELRSGETEKARALLARVLSIDPELRSAVVELAWTIGDVSPTGAYMCVDTIVEAALAERNYMDAAALLQEFATRVPGQIAALLKLVEICVDGGLEAAMYETQAQLADAYLEAGQGSEARVIAEDLVAREPWEPAHIDRFRRALVMLNVPDPDALIAERLSGQGPFVATDPFMVPEPLVPGEAAAPAITPDAPAAVPPATPESVKAVDVPPVANERPTPAGTPAPPMANAPVNPPPEIRKQVKKTGALEIDLTGVLDELEHLAPAMPIEAPPPRQNLEEVFKGIRDHATRDSQANEADEHMKLARTYIEMGMVEEAAGALALAARAPRHRFEAASMLGRLYLKRSDMAHAIEWLERAAEAPASSPEAGHELLYDLGLALELAGEVARALAIFLELQADAGDYRDVAARAEQLARVQSGG